MTREFRNATLSLFAPPLDESIRIYNQPLVIKEIQRRLPIQALNRVRYGARAGFLQIF